MAGARTLTLPLSTQAGPKAVEQESEQAYMLFYECRGVDYDCFLPDAPTPAESEAGDLDSREEGRKRDTCAIM